MDYSTLRFETRQIHAGLDKNDATGARGTAIYPTAAYRFRTCDHAAGLFELSEPGNIYTRLQNPTTSAYEERIAALYGGVGAMAVSSGMAGILIVATALASAGDNIVASPYLYGGTYNQFRHTLRRLGIEVRVAASESPADFNSLIDGKTRFIFAETMGNPTCAVPDLEVLRLWPTPQAYRLWPTTPLAPADICAILLNGVPTLWWIRPRNGSTATAMRWEVSSSMRDRFPGTTAVPQIDGPSEGYHGLNLYEAFGPAAFIVKCRVDGQRDLGTCPSPFDSYLMMLGLETLSLRVRHQVDATRALAEYLKDHPKVKNVSYVGFNTHPSHEAAAKYFRYGASGVLNVELKGDTDTTVKFVEALQLAAHMTMIGDSITVVTHPASTTHKQLSDADLAAAGVTPTLLRISLGLEAVEDIIADFEQAFTAAGL